MKHNLMTYLIPLKRGVFSKIVKCPYQTFSWYQYSYSIYGYSHFPDYAIASRIGDFLILSLYVVAKHNIFTIYTFIVILYGELNNLVLVVKLYE